jgi:hypothetical protein
MTVKAASSVSVGDESILIWRPQPEGVGCDQLVQPNEDWMDAEIRAKLRAAREANTRHPGSWWSSYDVVDGAAIFDDCQVEVLEGPLT